MRTLEMEQPAKMCCIFLLGRLAGQKARVISEVLVYSGAFEGVADVTLVRSAYHARKQLNF